MHARRVVPDEERLAGLLRLVHEVVANNLGDSVAFNLESDIALRGFATKGLALARA
jgi:hypothetical protein